MIQISSEEYVKLYEKTNTDKLLAVISDPEKYISSAKTNFHKGKIKEYKEEFWSKHDWGSIS